MRLIQLGGKPMLSTKVVISSGGMTFRIVFSMVATFPDVGFDVQMLVKRIVAK